MSRFVIAGTDTNVGKTVFAAGVAGILGAFYWKPVQCGLDGGVDTKTVQTLTGFTEDRFLPEQYIFTRALSPHRAAELDLSAIDPDALRVPDVSPLVIELAGGLMVPMTRKVLQIDVIKGWELPVILCARTGLGTLNHTLLSVEALKSRGIALHGIAFIGDENPDNMRTVHEFTGAKILGRLPIISPLNAQTLRGIFSQNFSLNDFRSAA